MKRDNVLMKGNNAVYGLIGIFFSVAAYAQVFSKPEPDSYSGSWANYDKEYEVMNSCYMTRTGELADPANDTILHCSFVLWDYRSNKRKRGTYTTREQFEKFLKPYEERESAPRG